MTAQSQQCVPPGGTDVQRYSLVRDTYDMLDGMVQVTRAAMLACTPGSSTLRTWRTIRARDEDLHSRVAFDGREPDHSDLLSDLTLTSGIRSDVYSFIAVASAALLPLQFADFPMLLADVMLAAGLGAKFWYNYAVEEERKDLVEGSPYDF